MKKDYFKNNLSKMYKSSKNCQEYMEQYGQYLAGLLSTLNHKRVSKVADCFLKARNRNATIFFTGNGGSAATASHFAQDIGEIGRKANVKPFKTMCLTESISCITALANDYGYDGIFTHQMENLFKKGDILVALSASGNSPNIVEAVRLAKKLKGTTVGFVGFDGGKLAKICDYVVQVDTPKGEYGPVEDIHVILDHMISTYLSENLYRKGRKK